MQETQSGFQGHARVFLGKLFWQVEGKIVLAGGKIILAGGQITRPIEIQKGIILIHRLTNTNKTHNKYKAQNQIQIQSPKPGNNFILPLNLDVDAPAQHRHAHLERGHVDHW